jgi:hypothetical protein
MLFSGSDVTTLSISTSPQQHLILVHFEANRYWITGVTTKLAITVINVIICTSGIFLVLENIFYYL